MTLSLLLLSFSAPFAGGDAVFLFGLYALYFIPLGILHLALASAVYFDAKRLQSEYRSGTFLVGAGLWCLATLLGGLATVAVYWLIHHSRLRPARPPAARATQAQP